LRDRLSPEKIRQAQTWEPNKKIFTNVLDGTLSKRYKQKRKVQKPATDSGSEHEEELTLTCDYCKILEIFLFLFVFLSHSIHAAYSGSKNEEESIFLYD